MPIVSSTTSPLVGQLSGVHFFGFDGAPCSQRVSFALAEKGLVRGQRVNWATTKPNTLFAPPNTYMFREVSLIKHDNTLAEYAKIQPNMVVPALVNDGELVIESMDIVSYLDEKWPQNPLRPADPKLAEQCSTLVEQAKALHVSVRYMTFRWSLGKLGKTDRATQERLASLQNDGSPEQLAEFYAKFNSGTIKPETFAEHLHALEAGYGEQDLRLRQDGGPFLLGEQFTIADIIWSIKVLRLIECGYPFAEYFPDLYQWYQRVAARPGFRDGVFSNNRFFHYAFRIKAKIENAFGRGIRSQSRAPQTQRINP